MQHQAPAYNASSDDALEQSHRLETKQRFSSPSPLDKKYMDYNDGQGPADLEREISHVIALSMCHMMCTHGIASAHAMLMA
jgi:hypothetical protein